MRDVAYVDADALQIGCMTMVEQHWGRVTITPRNRGKKNWPRDIESASSL